MLGLRSRHPERSRRISLQPYRCHLDRSGEISLFSSFTSFPHGSSRSASLSGCGVSPPRSAGPELHGVRRSLTQKVPLRPAAGGSHARRPSFFAAKERRLKKPGQSSSSWSALVSSTTNKTTHSGEIAPGNLSSIQTSFVACRKL